MSKIIVLFMVILMTVSGTLASEQMESSPKFYILISIEDCKLWLYETREQKQLVLIKEYSVSTVKTNAAYFPLGKGVVTEIIKNPYWYPTESIKEAFAERGINLPNAVPPGDPLNYMGSFKITLSHSVPGKGAVYRIHGTRKEDRDKIGKRVSGGCIRMLNEDGEELAKIISIGTPVEIVTRKN